MALRLAVAASLLTFLNLFVWYAAVSKPTPFRRSHSLGQIHRIAVWDATDGHDGGGS